MKTTRRKLKEFIKNQIQIIVEAEPGDGLVSVETAIREKLVSVGVPESWVDKVVAILLNPPPWVDDPFTRVIEFKDPMTAEDLVQFDGRKDAIKTSIAEMRQNFEDLEADSWVDLQGEDGSYEAIANLAMGKPVIAEGRRITHLALRRILEGDARDVTLQEKDDVVTATEVEAVTMTKDQSDASHLAWTQLGADSDPLFVTLEDAWQDVSVAADVALDTELKVFSGSTLEPIVAKIESLMSDLFPDLAIEALLIERDTDTYKQEISNEEKVKTSLREAQRKLLSITDVNVPQVLRQTLADVQTSVAGALSSVTDVKIK